MCLDNHFYTTEGNIFVARTVNKISIETALEEVLLRLDSQRGGLLKSQYEYPGRYTRWAIGFVNPPLELSTRDNTFTLIAHNQRGMLLLDYLSENLSDFPELCRLERTNNRLFGLVKPTEKLFSEEQRSRQPSVFTVVRKILHLFSSSEDKHLGLYGAFGYDLVFQFEQMRKQQERAEDQRDLVLYLPDELLIVDYYQQQGYRLQYDFVTTKGTTRDLPRSGEKIDYLGKNLTPDRDRDHQPGEYEAQVEKALEYFRRGDLFEVVPSQNFFKRCTTSPTQLFRILQDINPSPYGFIFNLGGEYLIGASPEMFVRVDGSRIETCPISGTIKRGKNAIEDAKQIQALLNSKKDESELTMCTDVDRNDKSRICKPGSVRVIGRRQIEMYSHLIHTVDHVEGILRPEFDALDAFLTHLWAVTVTGAPKRWAMQFLEQNERSPRRWYGGAIGCLTFNGNLNTGLILRTIRLQNAIAEVRAGATVLYDSDPKLEAEETIIKGMALFQTLEKAENNSINIPANSYLPEKLAKPGIDKHILLIDHEDSFVHTLANYVGQTGAKVTTLRHGFAESFLDRQRPDLVILSPGPGRPADFKLAATILACQKRQIPIFGVCLGLQGIVEAFGGELGVLEYPQHGKVAEISVLTQDSVLFQDLPNSFAVGRYHSLYALPETLPGELKVTATTNDGIIMAIEHRSLPIAAVQFHPESIMTLSGGIGQEIINNVVRVYGNIQKSSPLLVFSS